MSLRRRRQGDLDAVLDRIPWETLFHIVRFLLVAVVWLTLVPTRAARRPPPR